MSARRRRRPCASLPSAGAGACCSSRGTRWPRPRSCWWPVPWPSARAGSEASVRPTPQDCARRRERVSWPAFPRPSRRQPRARSRPRARRSVSHPPPIPARRPRKLARPRRSSFRPRRIRRLPRRLRPPGRPSHPAQRRRLRPQHRYPRRRRRQSRRPPPTPSPTATLTIARMGSTMTGTRSSMRSTRGAPLTGNEADG